MHYEETEVKRREIINIIKNYKKNLKIIFGNNINLFLSEDLEIDFEYKHNGSSVINLQEIKTAKNPQDFNTLINQNIDKKIVNAKVAIELVNYWFSKLSENQIKILFFIDIDSTKFRKNVDIKELCTNLKINRRQLYRERNKAIIEIINMNYD